MSGGAYASGATNYAGDIAQASQAYGVPTGILAALIQTESSFNPNAQGSAGEIGLTQITPALAAQMGLSSAQLSDPQTNINAGASYLASLFGQFGNWSQALQAYNAGPGAVSSGSQAGQGYATGVLGLAANTGNPVDPAGISSALNSTTAPAGGSSATASSTGTGAIGGFRIPGLPGWLNSVLSWAANNLIVVGAIALAGALIVWAILSLFKEPAASPVIKVAENAPEAASLA